MEHLISKALAKPPNQISYYVSQLLARLHSDRAMIEGSSQAFDLDAYARAGLCSVARELSIHRQISTEWQGRGDDLLPETENGYFNVLWQGHLLDVLLVSWSDDGCWSRYHWIVAESREIAERFFLDVCNWATEVRGEILVFDGSVWSKNERLFEAIRAASFDNLILPVSLKQEIQNDFARFFASRELYESYSIPWKRGVLLIGPPGNGKTHTVKAIVNQLRRPCLYVKSFKPRYGTVQGSIGAVFNRARQTAPCLVVLEDLDSLIDDKTRSAFLNEMDGFATNTGVVVLATTNHPERLDPAILDRPSRFDRKYHFNLPAAAERLRFIEAKNESLQPDMRLSEEGLIVVVKLTEGFSFAYLKELFLSSMMEWMEEMKSGGMDEIMSSRAAVLRGQMTAALSEPPIPPDDDDDDE
ncbi:MAG: ATP-binding protein [Acidobacteriota bacterium]